MATPRSWERPSHYLHPRGTDHLGQSLPEGISTDFTLILSAQGQQGSSEDCKEIAPVIYT